MKSSEELANAEACRQEPSMFPSGWTPSADGRRPRLLYFTRSVRFEHEAVARNGDELSFSEKILIEWGKEIGFDVDCSKEGSLFDDDFSHYDCLVLYCFGNLLRHNKPGEYFSSQMTERGKQRMMDAIEDGLPVVGFHAATDTFCKAGTKIDPFITMLGAEFCGHAWEQEASLRVTSPNFPGVEELGDGLKLLEEWYAFKKYNPDMHVILAQETRGMRGRLYNRPPYPATWARMHGKGRVFYTSLGHRYDVWTNPIFRQIALGGLSWALGHVDADVTPNYRQVTPHANRRMRVVPEPGTISR